MLKDITLGQYYPGTSPVHRMDPRTKLLSLIFYIVTIFVVKGAIPYAVCVLAVMAAVWVSTIPAKMVLKSLKPIVIIVIFTGILNMLYTPGREIFRVWILKITAEGVTERPLQSKRALAEDILDQVAALRAHSSDA